MDQGWSERPVVPSEWFVDQNSLRILIRGPENFGRAWKTKLCEQTHMQTLCKRLNAGEGRGGREKELLFFAPLAPLSGSRKKGLYEDSWTESSRDIGELMCANYTNYLESPSSKDGVCRGRGPPSLRDTCRRFRIFRKTLHIRVRRRFRVFSERPIT